MKELSTQDLITTTRELWNAVKEVSVQVAWNLHRIRESGEWESYGFKNFPEFCEKELDIGSSQVSKFKTIADYYFDRYTPEDIGAVAGENLYLSTKLPGTVEENLSRAKTLHRVDLKQEKAEADPHDPVWITYCEVCKLSQSNHP